MYNCFTSDVKIQNTTDIDGNLVLRPFYHFKTTEYKIKGAWRQDCTERGGIACFVFVLDHRD